MNTKHFRSLLLSLSLICVFLFSASPVLASGNLKTVNDNGALSVTTVPATDSATTTTTQTTFTTSQLNTRVPISAPTGFAQDIGNVINFALQAIMVIAVLLVFGFLILGGIEWITSGGEKSKTESARNKIVAAVVGLIVVASSYAVFLLILRLFGFKDLNEVLNSVHAINSSTVTTQVSTSSSQLREQNLVK